MKKLFIYALGLLPLSLMAQVDRSKAPAPDPAPQIKIGQPATFTLPNGLKIFVVQNTKLPRVSATLSFDMDGIVEGDKTGITSMGGQLLRRGTTTMNKAQLDEQIDFLGGYVSTSATSASASSLKDNFPQIMKLMSDVVLRPSLPESELEKIRKQELSGLQASKDDPNAIADNVLNRLVYGKDHPYGDIETEETLNNVKLEDIKKYFNTWWKPNNAYLVFVGDITPAKAKELAVKHFGSWKKGTVPSPKYNTPQQPAKTYIALVDRPASVQTVISFAAPIEIKPGAPDAIAASVMNNILGGGFSGRLFANLREKYAFTYGAYSNLRPDRLAGVFTAEASVRNEKTDSAIGQFLHEFNRLRNEPIPEDEVDRMKNYLSGSFARSLENPATIANFALNIARYNLPKNYYQDYLKNLGSVSTTDVQAMAKKYVQTGNMHIILVGNAKEIAPGLEKYGEVKYYNVYGQQIEAPQTKTVSADVTPKTILQKAIDAYGGAAALASIRDIDMKGKASIMNQEINIAQKNVIPSAFSQEMSVQGMTVQKRTMSGDKFNIMAQGQSQDVEDKDKEEMKEEAAFFLEPYLLNNASYFLKLNGIEQVDGKDAYALYVESPSKRKFTNYYDVKSGMLVKQIKVQEGGPMGTVTVTTSFDDYETFNGVKIPTKITTDLGMMKFDIEFDEIKVNTGLKAEDIK